MFDDDNDDRDGFNKQISPSYNPFDKRPEDITITEIMSKEPSYVTYDGSSITILSANSLMDPIIICVLYTLIAIFIPSILWFSTENILFTAPISLFLFSYLEIHTVIKEQLFPHSTTIDFDNELVLMHGFFYKKRTTFSYKVGSISAIAKGHGGLRSSSTKLYLTIGEKSWNIRGGYKYAYNVDICDPEAVFLASFINKQINCTNP